MKTLTNREKVIVSLGVSIVIVFLFMRYIGNSLNMEYVNTTQKLESLKILLVDKQNYLQELKGRDLKSDIKKIDRNIAYKQSTKLHLKAILNSKSYINNNWYKVGDTLNGCKLVKINIESVNIQCGDFISSLKLNSSKGYIKVMKEEL